MYVLIDGNGIERGLTSDRFLVHPLKEALEAVLGCRIYIAVRTSCGDYVFGM